MNDEDIQRLTAAHPYTGVYSPTGARPKTPDQPKPGILKPRTLAEQRSKVLPEGFPKDLTSYYMHPSDQIDPLVYSDSFLSPKKPGQTPSKAEKEAKVGKITAARNRHCKAIELMNQTILDSGLLASEEHVAFLIPLCQGTIICIKHLMKTHETLAPQAFKARHLETYTEYLTKVGQNLKTLLDIQVSTSVPHPELDLTRTRGAEFGEDTAHGSGGEEEEEVVTPDRSFGGARDRAMLEEPPTSLRGHNPWGRNPRGRGTRSYGGPEDRDFDFRTLMNYLVENQARDRQARSFTPIPPRKQEKARLPTLSIPKFSGKEEDWVRFRNRFTTAMEPYDISNEERALRLIDHCQGEAIRLIEHLTTTSIDESTYDTLMEILEQRYGGQYIEDSHISKMLDSIPMITKMSTPELVKLFESMSSIAIYYRRTNPDILIDTTSQVLRMIKQKFAQKQLGHFLEHCMHHEVDAHFNSLLKFVSAKLEIARQSEKQSASGARTAPRSSIQKLQEVEDDVDSSDDSESDLVLAIQQLNRKVSKLQTRRFGNRASGKDGESKGKSDLKPTLDSCPLCSAKHYLFKCPSFLKKSIKNRFTSVKQLKVCFHCLGGIHVVKDCTFRKDVLCQLDGCERYHHPLLHAESALKLAQFEDQDDSQTRDDQSDCYYIAGKNTFSLQTIVCNLQVGRKSHRIVVLLDNGSQGTYVDAKFARSLALPVGETFTKTVKIANKRQEVECAFTKLQLSNIDGHNLINVKALTLQGLAEGTNVVDWKKRKLEFEHLKGIDFPELPRVAEISVLIGIDNKHLHKASRIVDGKSDHEPSAFKTPLGWTCLGASSPQQVTSLTFISGCLLEAPEDSVDIDTWVEPQTDFDV